MTSHTAADLQSQAQVAAEALLENIEQRDAESTRRFLDSLPRDIKEIVFLGGTQGSPYPALKDVNEFLPAACQKGDTEIIDILIDVGADPKLRGKKGSPIQVATLYNHKAIVEKLIAYKPDLIKDPVEVKSCLQKACETSSLELVEYWLGQLNSLYSEKTTHSATLPKPDINVDPQNHAGQDLAQHRLQGDSFYITKETVKYASDVLSQVLEVWVENDSQEDGQTKLCANWARKHLYTFEQHWLDVPRYTNALVNIDLSHNSLGTIPRLLLWGLPWMETLSLAHNQISKLPAPASLDQAKNSCLKSLSIAHNRLKDVPSELFLLPNLQMLDLGHNHIANIKPAHIELRIGKQDMLQSAWNCQHLCELVLSNNQLTKIPTDIRGAIKLTTLDLSHNRLQDMPLPWHCPLEELFLTDNQLQDMPDMSAFWHQTLRVLRIANNNFTKIPLSVCYLTALESLDLSGNGIKQLPSIMEWQTGSLQRLNLASNDLVHYGSGKRQDQGPKSPIKGSILKRFASVDRKETQGLEKSRQSSFFTEIDDVHGTLAFPKSFNSSLNVLDLSFNQLEDVPQGICDMKALQALDLRGNCDLTRLPVELGLLVDLYSLKVDATQIKEPPEVEYIIQNEKSPTRKIQKVLRHKLFNCQPYRGVKLMLVGPEKSGKTTLMTCLTGHDWPIDNKGVNVVEWNLTKVQAESRRRSRASSSTNMNMLRRLGRSQSQADEDISFTVWDLKGGDDYALIHQTLFTPHTLYILVWDIGDREAGIEKLRPWLLNIQSQAPQSMIVTVGTHLDQLSTKSGYREQTIEGLHEIIQEKFPTLIENFVEVEALHSNGAGVKELKTLLYECALQMTYRQEHGPVQEIEPLVSRKVPEVFQVLKQRLAEERISRQKATPPIPQLMTEAELGNIIRESPTRQIQSAEQLEEVVFFLQDTGSLIHVSDHTYRLTNVYFLDPAWLCSVLYAVVQLHDDYYLQDGMIPKSRLEELCEKSGFGRSRFEEYLQLLMRFEIALPVGLNRYLVPSLLPKGRPVFDRTAKSIFKHTLMRWYRMSYIPPGFWSRLVARLMVNVKNMDAKKTIKRRSSSIRKFSEGSVHLRQAHSAVWQEGMHIHHESGQIQIEPMRFPDRRPGIRITVRDKRGVFQPMGFIVDHVESLLSEWYPGLEQSRFDGTTHVQRLIPCPTCLSAIYDESNSGDRINEFDSIKVFPLEDLAIAAALNGQDEILCEMHRDVPVSLRSLVPDLFLVDLGISILDSDLTVGKKLGSGAFGEVFKAVYKDRPVAVKMLMKSSDQHPRNPPSQELSSVPSNEVIPMDDEAKMLSVINTFPKLRNEVAMMSRLKHPCILKLIGASVHKLLFAMEYAPMGDLASELHLQYVCSRPAFVCDRVVQGTLLPPLITYKMALQVMAAINYLHTTKVVHTDLKTDNILLFSLDPEDVINVKLADYGISHNLDAGGNRGEAGFHAFSAPEILRGKAFDEKVDIFSFGMLLHHIMSGILPFEDLQNSVETKAAVTSGIRPSFEWKEYSMLPRFYHIENLMTSCWQDSPVDRPHAREILQSMRSASFLCLRNVLKLESDSEVCLYGSGPDDSIESSSPQHERNQYRMWLWRGHNEKRSFIEFNVEYSQDSDVVSNEWHGPRVTCAVQVNNLHIHGTEENTVNVYAMKGLGDQTNFAHLAELCVPSEVVSLSYQEHKNQKSSDEPYGHLFAGLKDGCVIIFLHQSCPDDPTTDWNQFEILKLGNKKPCTCMQLIPERNELWVGCGNTIRIITIPKMKLEEKVITVDQVNGVQGFSYQGKHMWCFVQGSPVVVQYDMESRKRVDSFDCGSVVMSKGEVLSVCDLTSTRDSITEEEETDPADDETKRSSATMGHIPDKESVDVDERNPGGLSEPGQSIEGSDNDDILERLTLDEADEAVGIHQSATLPADARRRGLSDTFRQEIEATRHSMYTGPNLPTIQTKSATSKIHSMAVVEDTLWVGRDLGDVLVISIQDNEGYRCGQVVAILSMSGMLASPVNHLLRVGNDRVVVCQEIVGESGLFKHHVLVWKKWGTEKFKQFDDVHSALEQASMKTR